MSGSNWSWLKIGSRAVALVKGQGVDLGVGAVALIVTTQMSRGCGSGFYKGKGSMSQNDLVMEGVRRGSGRGSAVRQTAER